MYGAGRQCSFCLQKNPVHRVSPKCGALMAKRMNVEITAMNFPLLYTLPEKDATNLETHTEPINAIFVHVQKRALRKIFPGLQNDAWYICVVYVHAADCIGRFIVPCTKISEWTAQSKTRVFISAADALPKTVANASQKAAVSPTRAYLSMSMSANTQYYTSCTHVLTSTYLYYS
jgi:hypothetical protein